MFVTGGVGGVHRGGERSLDVSADLAELGRAGTPVVSAGVKSILDIGRTLEFLVRIKDASNSRQNTFIHLHYTHCSCTPAVLQLSRNLGPALLALHIHPVYRLWDRSSGTICNKIMGGLSISVGLQVSTFFAGDAGRLRGDVRPDAGLPRFLHPEGLQSCQMSSFADF